MVGQVASVIAAVGAQLAFVWLLSRVGPHVSLEVALISRGEGAEVTLVWLLACVDSSVLQQRLSSLAGIAAVRALQLPVQGPPQVVQHQHRAPMQGIAIAREAGEAGVTGLLGQVPRQLIHLAGLLAQVLPEVLQEVLRLHPLLPHLLLLTHRETPKASLRSADAHHGGQARLFLFWNAHPSLTRVRMLARRGRGFRGHVLSACSFACITGHARTRHRRG